MLINCSELYKVIVENISLMDLELIDKLKEDDFQVIKKYLTKEQYIYHLINNIDSKTNEFNKIHPEIIANILTKTPKKAFLISFQEKLGRKALKYFINYSCYIKKNYPLECGIRIGDIYMYSSPSTIYIKYSRHSVKVNDSIYIGDDCFKVKSLQYICDRSNNQNSVIDKTVKGMTIGITFNEPFEIGITPMSEIDCLLKIT